MVTGMKIETLADLEKIEADGIVGTLGVTTEEAEKVRVPSQ